jgi:crooked neck
MEWHPDEQAWQTYINFELRYKEIDRARSIYERFVYTHPDVKHWIKYARFEEKHGFIRSARKVYERAVDFYGEDYMDERLFIAFAKFEENQREVSSLLLCRELCWYLLITIYCVLSDFFELAA